MTDLIVQFLHGLFSLMIVFFSGAILIAFLILMGKFSFYLVDYILHFIGA